MPNYNTLVHKMYFCLVQYGRIFFCECMSSLDPNCLYTLCSNVHVTMFQHLLLIIQKYWSKAHTRWQGSNLHPWVRQCTVPFSKNTKRTVNKRLTVDFVQISFRNFFLYMIICFCHVSEAEKIPSLSHESRHFINK